MRINVVHQNLVNEKSLEIIIYKAPKLDAVLSDYSVICDTYTTPIAFSSTVVVTTFEYEFADNEMIKVAGAVTQDILVAATIELI